ncbi:hypothetical protein [Fortiea sp. LEGE XX443]
MISCVSLVGLINYGEIPSSSQYAADYHWATYNQATMTLILDI